LDSDLPSYAKSKSPASAGLGFFCDLSVSAVSRVFDDSTVDRFRIAGQTLPIHFLKWTRKEDVNLLLVTGVPSHLIAMAAPLCATNGRPLCRGACPESL